MRRRRLHMQLTPLLDLLLIVIFAQYMDVAEREATTVGEAKQAIAQRDAMAAQLTQAELSHQQTTDRLAQLTAIVAQLQSQNTDLSQEADQNQRGSGAGGRTAATVRRSGERVVRRAAGNGRPSTDAARGR